MKNKWLENFNPYQGGGSMIDTVEIDKTKFAKGFQKYEAGTPPIAQVIGLGSSINFVKKIGLENIYKYEKELHDYTIDKLSSDKDISIYGKSFNKGAIISFNIKGIHANDLAMFLDQKNIAVRTGHHCCQPLMQYFNITSTARASFGIYNDKSDANLFINSLFEAKKFFI